jgi:ribonucleotide reductase beta subunit family protein with ferritin-like domain
MEPLFDASSVTLGERYTLFPIKPSEQGLMRLYKQAVASFWPVEEVDLSKDRQDWEKLTDNEQHFIKNILAFFAGSDGIVQENLAGKFQVEVQSPVARLFYGLQNAMEGIHSEMYSLLIDQYIKDPQEQTRLFRAIDTVPSIRKKALWALNWMNDQKSYAHRLLAFACVEGIFFSGAFCSIYYFKKRGLLPGLTFSNQLISRDEALHTEFAVEMYKLLEHKLDQDEALKIVEDAVQIETEFICDSLPCSLIGMNARDMTLYIQFVADRLLVQLGYPKLYQAQNPFDFMELISLEGKSNFFEKKVGEYAKPGVGLSSESMQIKFNEEF